MVRWFPEFSLGPQYLSYFVHDSWSCDGIAEERLYLHGIVLTISVHSPESFRFKLQLAFAAAYVFYRCWHFPQIRPLLLYFPQMGHILGWQCKEQHIMKASFVRRVFLWLLDCIFTQMLIVWLSHTSQELTVMGSWRVVSQSRTPQVPMLTKQLLSDQTVIYP